MVPASQSGDLPPLRAEQLTWAALLVRWIEFAKAAVAFPDDRGGRRMRQSVPDVIMLQAVWFSLQNLDELDADQRALGLDRAEVLIDKHAAAIVARWKEELLPKALREIIDDARQTLDGGRKSP